MKRVIILICTICVPHLTGAGKTFRDWKPGDKVQYLRPEAPAFHMEQVKGEHYGLL